MAKYFYHLSTPGVWQSSSGNGILAMVNKTGSNKKINIHSIEVVNNSRFGYASTANTQTPPPTKFKIGPVSDLGGGYDLTPLPMDSQATFPAAIQIKTGAAYTPIFIDEGASLSYTATANSVGPYTVSAQTPAWTTNEHRDGCKWFHGLTGNVGYWQIAANAATTFTLSKAVLNSGASTGQISTMKVFAQSNILKTLNTSTTTSYPVVNFGTRTGKDFSSGSIFNSAMISECQSIVVRAGEKLAVFVDWPMGNLPVFVSADVIVEGSPNRTYVVEFYTYIRGEMNAIFSIDNNTGSGLVINLENIDVSEVGTHDTAYFQVVPIAAVNAVTYTDPNRKITTQALANDSTSPALASSVCDIFQDAAVLPYGVPVSYVAPSSPGAATVPPGYNYLNTKDFIGPVYMALFPEASAFKRADANFWGYPTPGTLGSQLSSDLCSLKGQTAPIVLREGEGFAIVSGAETAAGATVNSVGGSGWVGFDFNLHFSVEDARYPTLNITGMVPNSRFSIETYPQGAMLYESTADGTGNYNYQYTGSTPQSLRVRVRKGSAAPKYNPWELVVSVTGADISIQVAQVLDTIAS